MSESKVVMFPEQENMMSVLAPLLQQRGVDPNVLLAMNRNGFGQDGSWFIWILFLFLIFGWGNWGNQNQGQNGLVGVLSNDNGRELLMQAINGNDAAISQLASSLNCSVSGVQSAVSQLMTQVQGVGSQVGLSSQQVINALQQGDAGIASQLASCCCENRLAICQQTNSLESSINSVATGQERGFSTIAFETQRQTCDLQNSLAQATQQILDGQRSAELREMQGKIDTLRELNSQKDVILNNSQQTAVFQQMLQPVMGAISSLQTELQGIKCNLPQTATIPYSPVVGVPASVAAEFGLGSFINTFHK